jgi:uncharacterized membrane protein YdbT with pleckstrin-like domain
VARYADTLLADGERIALRTRQHWLAPVVDARGPWAVFVVSVVVLVLAGMATGDLRSIVGWIGLGGLVVSLILLGHRYWAWLAQDYIVTNRRVLKVEGIINKRSADSSLEKINDAVLDQNIFGRIFGYGDLDILTAADTAIDRYRMLRDAPGFKKAMLDAKHRLDLEMVRGTAPAMRAPSSRTMSPDEVTKALGDLADLRDRGALSGDEYEAKKADLLGRL